MWAQCSQRPTWPPSATVRQRSIALITFSWSPTTWALQQVGSYPGYTGRDANVVAKAAFDPNRSIAACNACVATSMQLTNGAALYPGRFEISEVGGLIPPDRHEIYPSFSL